jgi:hypothetical protein
VIPDEENPPNDESAFESEAETALKTTKTTHGSLDPVQSEDDSDEEDDGVDEEIKHMISAYLTHDPPLHPRRCEHLRSLSITRLILLEHSINPITTCFRAPLVDKDQVVSRRSRKELLEMRKELQTSQHARVEPPSSHNILMVDQLSFGTFQQKRDKVEPTYKTGTTNSAPDKSASKKSPPEQPDIIITNFPSSWGVQVMKSTAVDDLRETVLRSQNLHPRDLIHNPSEPISRILRVCCKGLDRHQNVKIVEFLQIFQSTIGDAVSPQYSLETISLC